MTFETDIDETQPAGAEPSAVDELLSQQKPSDYVDQVIELYEASERNYRAAMLAGHVVNGFSDSTNY